MSRSLVFTLFLAALAVPLASPAADGDRVRLRLATTTSTDNSGLLEHVLPYFEEESGIKVDVIAVGTGKALKLAERGDVDVILVHAPAAELAFVEAGWGVNRQGVMVNDFLIVGPADDPAQLGQTDDLAGALAALKETGGAFVSRGDDSGTHKKERSLWPLAGGPPADDRYLESGQGMEATLRIAHEKEAYTLTDRGTFLALRERMELHAAYEGDRMLENPYSVIAVNPASHGHVKYLEAMCLVAWLTSPRGQELIGAFRVGGEILFHPTAVPLK